MDARDARLKVDLAICHLEGDSSLLLEVVRDELVLGLSGYFGTDERGFLFPAGLPLFWAHRGNRFSVGDIGEVDEIVHDIFALLHLYVQNHRDAPPQSRRGIFPARPILQPISIKKGLPVLTVALCSPRHRPAPQLEGRIYSDF